MFSFALLVGVYSYLIFFLGILGWLYEDIVVWLTVAFLCGVFGWLMRDRRWIGKIREIGEIKKSKLLILLLLILLLQALVNFIGALGPELAFDALWYHLTFPKLWLINHRIDFIPGGLLYYSVMPKLGEMLYVSALSFGNEITAKILHYFFGLLTCVALFKLQRKFFTPFISMIGVVIFYSNLVVAWESITAYIDLIRTFFEVMALWGFINWYKPPSSASGRTSASRGKWLVLSAFMLGLAITTKLLAVGSLVIFTILILIGIRGRRWMRRIRDAVIFLLVSLLVPLPWFIFSYIHTGNPVYPFFTEVYRVTAEQFSLFGFVREVWVVFTQAADPVSPIYIIFLPLIVWLVWKKRLGKVGVIGIYSFLAIIIWYFTPRTGGGRFILPYLPALSILCVYCYSEILKNTRIASTYLSKFLLGVVILVSIISIGYRGIANSKYPPVLLGQETKKEFLTKYLNFSFGDFYDTDNYFRNTIKQTDKVLLYGFHNLYYVDFPFIDSSWQKPTDTFNYIAIQNTKLPEEYKNWRLIYTNDKTMVKLYTEMRNEK